MTEQHENTSLEQDSLPPVREREHDERRISPPDDHDAVADGRGSVIINIFALLLLVLSVFGLAFTPLRGSQDEWWHLKTGRWIWENRALPLNDIFTYTGENIRWFNHEWLSQIIFYGVYRAGDLLEGAATGVFSDGLRWLIGFKSVVVVAAFVLVARLAFQRMRDLPGGWAAACVIGVIAADISRRTIYPRPPIFSYVFFAAFLLVLYGWKRGYLNCKWLWLLVPATVLWANMHGMVLLSVVAIGAFAAGELVENCCRWVGVQFERERGEGQFFSTVFTRRHLFLWLLTALAVVACMAQPSGYHIFFLGRNFTADPLLQKIILEMMPTPMPFMATNPEAWWDLQSWRARPPGFWTFWVALVIVGVLLIRNRFRLPYGADYLLLAFFTYQAVMHWRLLPLFAIAAAGPVGSLVAGRIREWRPAVARWQQGMFAVGLAALVGWFNFTVAEPPPETFFRRNLQLARGKVANLSDYPAPLMDYIEKSGLPPRMFSDSNYCGYAMWRLSPERFKLFTDNRFDVFGSEFIWLERMVFFALNPGDRLDGRTVTEGWQDILSRYGVNFIVFRPIDKPEFFKALQQSDNWRLIYYYVAPEASPFNFPLEGYYVYLRESVDAQAHADKAASVFARQFPNQPLPSEIARLLAGR